MKITHIDIIKYFDRYVLSIDYIWNEVCRSTSSSAVSASGCLST